MLVDLSGPLGARDRSKAAGTALVRELDESRPYLAESEFVTVDDLATAYRPGIVE